MKFDNLRLSLFQNNQAVNSKAVTIQEIIRLIKYDDTVRDKQALYDDLCTRVTEKYAKEKVKEEGKKRPVLTDVDKQFEMDKVKYTKYIISFK